MLWYLLICLAISLLTIGYYAYTGFHSKSHRLLPLALGMVCLYNFYMTIDYIAGYPEVMLLLKRLLLIQIVVIIFYYQGDFFRLQIKPVFRIMLLIALVATDNVVFVMFHMGMDYAKVITIFLVICVFVCVCETICGYRVRKLTKIEYINYGTLYVAMSVPTAAMMIVMLTNMRDIVLLPGAFSISCVLVLYLLATNNLEETRYRLENDYFMNSDIVSVIYDSEFNFLEANTKAYSEFPELIEKFKGNSLRDWLNNDLEDREREYKGRYYRVHVLTVKKKGVIHGYILTSVDITGEKEQVNYMESLKEAAEREARLKGEFLASMSHDLRSPLHAIIGGSDILLGRNDLFTKDRNMVYQIREAGKHLLEIVNDILDYSKLERGRLEFEHNEFEMEELFINQAQNCFMVLKDRPIKFILNLHNTHPKTLIGDEVRVKGIVQNLLSNAIKFTKEGSIKLDVYCSFLRPDKVKLIIQVEDTGTGIKSEYIDSIFKKYVSYNTGSKQEGTGLGLAIVKNLCEKMDGGIVAESNGKSGTLMTATIYLHAVPGIVREPISMDSDSAMSVAGNVSIVRPSWVYPKARVLIADDMAVNLNIIKEMVRPWQFAVDLVQDGDEAVEKVKDEKYDLIILDQMMPNMTGEEAAVEIRKLCDTPLVMMTADITDERKQRCQEIGFSGYIAKPIDLEKLKSVLEKLLPEDIRERAPILNMDMAPKLDGKGQLEAYYTSLRSYVKEVSDIRANLKKYYREDLEKFRIKVHGIKGISNQLGKNRIGTHAEIIEMAAKCDNMKFIEEHLQDFLEDVDVTLEMTNMELSNIKERLDQEKSSIFRMKMDDGYLDNLFEEIKDGFKKYDVTKIEEALEELRDCHLNDDQAKLLEEIQEAFDEFEYEKGLALFDK